MTDKEIENKIDQKLEIIEESLQYMQGAFCELISNLETVRYLESLLKKKPGTEEKYPLC